MNDHRQSSEEIDEVFTEGKDVGGRSRQVRNGWQVPPRISGRFEPEWVAGLGRNLQKP